MSEIVAFLVLGAGVGYCLGYSARDRELEPHRRLYAKVAQAARGVVETKRFIGDGFDEVRTFSARCEDCPITITVSTKEMP